VRAPGFLSVTLLFVACGGNVVVDQARSGTGGAAGAGGTVSASDDAGVVCKDAGLPSLADGYKACAADTDCTSESITDCCTTFVMGIALADVGAYEAYVSTCTSYAPCPCPSNGGATFADDGKQPGSAVIEVACQAGRCSSFVP
jgi:hypothetical protein